MKNYKLGLTREQIVEAERKFIEALIYRSEDNSIVWESIGSYPKTHDNSTYATEYINQEITFCVEFGVCTISCDEIYIYRDHKELLKQLSRVIGFNWAENKNKRVFDMLESITKDMVSGVGCEK